MMGVYSTRFPCGFIYYNYKNNFMEIENFGEHFIIDGYGASLDLLNSPQVMLKLFEDIIRDTDMHPLAKAIIVESPGNNGKDPGGVTGVQLIEESHISIHTFAKRGFVSGDIYTCKNGMDADHLKKLFIDAYGITDAEVTFLKRGTRYPASNIY